GLLRIAGHGGGSSRRLDPYRISAVGHLGPPPGAGALLGSAHRIGLGRSEWAGALTREVRRLAPPAPARVGGSGRWGHRDGARVRIPLSGAGKVNAVRS